MARPLRIEYPGAVYHVICRGNNRQAIFRDDQDRKRYLEKLSLYCQEKESGAYGVLPDVEPRQAMRLGGLRRGSDRSRDFVVCSTILCGN